MKNLKSILFFLMLTTNVSATPTGADLLEACEDSFKNGFHGSTGMMCVWYVTPCDCHYGKNADIPRVCLPEGKEPESLAEEVINGLKSEPALQSKSAEVSAAEILVKQYPCD